MQRLNRQWRGKDKPTDVLSFPQFEVDFLRVLDRNARRGGPIGSWALGDIVISLEKATEQAKDHGQTLRAELDFLLVHGILHLLGYDHEISPKEERRMKRLEKLLLTR